MKAETLKGYSAQQQVLNLKMHVRRIKLGKRMKQRASIKNGEHLVALEIPTVNTELETRTDVCSSFK